MKVLVQCPISVVNGGVLNDDMVHRVGLATRAGVEHDAVIADVNRLVIFLNESNTDSASVSWQRRYCCLGDDHRLRLRSVDTVGRKGETLYALKMTPDQRSVPCSFCPRGVTFHWVVGVGTHPIPSHPIPWLHLNCLSIQTIPRGAITVFVESALGKELGVSGIGLSPIF